MADWKRCRWGWLRRDGEVFLERGGILTDTGHHNWCVWIRALDGEVHVDGLGAYHGADAVRRLSEIAGGEFEQDNWFIQAGDEGWLSLAKHNAELHLADRDKRRAS